MSNIGRPAFGAGIPYWNGSVLRWSGAPTTGYVPYWTGSAISWTAPPTTLFGATDQYSYYKTRLGYNAGNTGSAEYSVDIGRYAGYNAGSASDRSTHVGSNAGYDTDGEGNLCVGYNCGYNYSYGSYNMMLGLNCNLLNTSDTHSIILGVGTPTVALYGKGSYSTLIGDLLIDDVWIRGDTFHFGDETATGDKFWFFTRSSAASGHPGFKWNETDDQIEWSNDGSTWTPLGGGGSSTFSFPISGSSDLGAAVSMRRDPSDSTVKAVQVNDYAIGFERTASFTVVAFESSPPAPTGVYPMDACSLEFADQNMAEGFVVAHAYGNALRIQHAHLTWSSASASPSLASWDTPLDIACTGQPSMVSICSVGYEELGTADKAHVAWVDAGVGYVAYLDLSTNPPTASTPLAFNDKGGTITAVTIAADHNNTYGNMFQSVVAWSVSGATYDNIYSRECRSDLSSTSRLGNTGNMVGEGFPADVGTLSLWLEGYNSSYSPEPVGAVAFGREGTWIGQFAEVNSFWPSAYYNEKPPLVRVDGPASDGTSMGYVIDVANSYRPHEGCFLDDTCYVEIVWGSRTGFDATFCNVVERDNLNLKVHGPQIVRDPIGDPTDTNFPGVKLRATCCRRMTDGGFAFAGFQTYSTFIRPVVGCGYVDDAGNVSLSYAYVNGYYMHAPGNAAGYDVTDDLQRAVPVRVSEDLFYVIMAARTSPSGTTNWYWVGPSRVPAKTRIVGTQTDAGSPTNIYPTGSTILSGFSNLYVGAEVFRRWDTILGRGRYHPGVKYRLGFAISATEVAVVPNRR